MYFLNNYMKKNINIVFYLLFLHELKFSHFQKKNQFMSLNYYFIYIFEKLSKMNRF